MIGDVFIFEPMENFVYNQPFAFNFQKVKKVDKLMCGVVDNKFYGGRRVSYINAANNDGPFLPYTFFYVIGKILIDGHVNQRTIFCKFHISRGMECFCNCFGVSASTTFDVIIDRLQNLFPVCHLFF